MNRVIHKLQQGSEAWHAHRAMHLNASEAPIVLGISPHMSRSEFVKLAALGDEKEVTAFQRKLFADGHAAEAGARVLAEELLGEDLYPCTMSLQFDGLPLSVSLDGLTLDDDTVFEHKKRNKALVEAMSRGVIPEPYRPQCEQALLITGASRCLFMASDGTRESAVHCWYESDPELRSQLIGAWKQFQQDVKNYQHVEQAAPVVGTSSVSGLPVLIVRANGKITESNFEEFHAAAMKVIESVNTQLVTDADFADADENIKSFEKAEKQLETVEAQVLAGMTDINKIVTGLRDLRETMRKKRLGLNSHVTTRKEARRGEILKSGQTALAEHVTSLNQRLGKDLMPAVAADFAGAMRAKKTIKSLVEAVDGELTRAKIAANAAADNIDRNLKLLASDGVSEYAFLFADLRIICLKANDDFTALVKTRIGDHVAAEAKKKAEADRKAQEATQAAATAQTTAPSANAAPAQSSPAREPIRTASSNRHAVDAGRPRPRDDQLLSVAASAVATEFAVSFERASEWLQQVDWEQATV